MNHWFTRPDAPIVSMHVKRFDPLHWTVDFPRGAMASVVTTPDEHGLSVKASFLRKGDLVGLIFESADRFAHPAHARETSRDYSGCVLRFQWQSVGLAGLDAVNGPTLTIEGRNAAGAPRFWYVRLWNYAVGSPTDAVITLDFDALDGGFGLPANADRVDPRDIDRMFISLIPPGFEPLSTMLWPVATQASVTISGLRCDGSGSVLALNDAVVGEHGLRIATAYDDMYNLPPERIIRAIERLGHRGVINHYIGMSHYFALDGAGLVDPAKTFNASALAWHRDFARAAKARGFAVIWSVSYEILDMFCPAAWKQRARDGSAAATGYVPPSTLVSPASAAGIAYLRAVAVALAGLSVEAGLIPPGADRGAVVVDHGDQGDLPVRRCGEGCAGRKSSGDRRCPGELERGAACIARCGGGDFGSINREHRRSGQGCGAGGEDAAAGLSARIARPVGARGEAGQFAARLGAARVRCAPARGL